MNDYFSFPLIFISTQTDKILMEDNKKAVRLSQSYPSGDIIFKEGQSGDCAYLIEKGQIEIYVSNKE